MLTLWLDHGRDTEVLRERIQEDKEKERTREKDKALAREAAELASARAKTLKVRQAARAPLRRGVAVQSGAAMVQPIRLVAKLAGQKYG